MKNLTLIKKAVLVSLFVTALSANAQKLPGVQKNSVYAPANIKTDGKTTEWNDKLQAQNNATMLYYTIANDNDNLYITIQAKDASTISKMLNGGMTFTVKSPDKALKSVAINFPLFKRLGLTGVQKTMSDDAIDVDTVLNKMNKQLTNSLNEIGVTGVKEITDTLISVYNEYGIKDAVQYDNKRALTAEIVIPLKYINPLIGAEGFKYNMILNGIKMSNLQVSINNKPTESGAALSPQVAELMNKLMTSTSKMQEQFSNTDFSGRYVLAKK